MYRVAIAVFRFGSEFLSLHYMSNPLYIKSAKKCFCFCLYMVIVSKFLSFCIFISTLQFFCCSNLTRRQEYCTKAEKSRHFRESNERFCVLGRQCRNDFENLMTTSLWFTFLIVEFCTFTCMLLLDVDMVYLLRLGVEVVHCDYFLRIN